ncbi:nucleoside deaminase, partial [Streptomyces sp. NPDC001273]|uniref:nucleoside deaminase n=1 Tax=unclassified Streptomyces TaxID=2593676 RepID=UPI0033E40CDD
MVVRDDELPYLRRCVELAAEALESGDEPFGSVLVAGDGTVLAEDHNRVASGDRTRHPEFELARWAAARMPRYLFRGPARGPLAFGPGMTVAPCRTDDLGGG